MQQHYLFEHRRAWQTIVPYIPLEITTLADIGFSGEPITPTESSGALLCWDGVPECEPMQHEYLAEQMRQGHEIAVKRRLCARNFRSREESEAEDEIRAEDGERRLLSAIINVHQLHEEPTQRERVAVLTCTRIMYVNGIVIKDWEYL